MVSGGISWIQEHRNKIAEFVVGSDFYWYTQSLTQQDSIEAFLNTPIQGSKLQKVDNKLFPFHNNYPHPSFAAEEVEGNGGSSNTSGSLGLLLLGTTALKKRTKFVIRMYSHCRVKIKYHFWPEIKCRPHQWKASTLNSAPIPHT